MNRRKAPTRTTYAFQELVFIQQNQNFIPILEY